MRPLVAVVGGGEATAEQLVCAEELGAIIVDLGARLLTGGRAGVMEAASRGARQARAYQEGAVVGLLPGADMAEANPFLDIAIPTGLGQARNAVIATACTAMVVVGGAAGALSEAALARKLGKPVLVVSGSGGIAARLGPDLLPGVVVVPDVGAAGATLTAWLSPDVHRPR